jgi:hypothetical protein
MSDKYLNGEGLEHLVEKIKSLVVVSSAIQDNAASHNAFYVEEDITEMYNDGTFTRNVENGTFKDIFPGMYITKTYTAAGIESNITEDFIVGDLDYFMHSGDTELKTHHALVLMKNGNKTLKKMNASDTTSGGYVESEMWTTTIPSYSTAVENAFGSSHILEHKEYLTNNISTSVASKGYAGFTGAASDFAWTNVKFNLMNNNMVYGSQITSSSYYDAGNRTQQITAIRHNSNLKIGHRGKGGSRQSYWLSDVMSSSRFAYASEHGYPNQSSANNFYYVRGYFLLK